MQKFKILLIFFLITLATFSYAANKEIFSNADFQKIVKQYFDQYSQKEYFSGVALSVYIPNNKIRSFYDGKISHESVSPAIDANTLFQIGSITKSFTAAIILQLEKQNKLKLIDTLDQRTTQYPKWNKTTIAKLLNMTSGLPNYTENPLWNAEIYYHPDHQWTDAELIRYAYGNNTFSPPLKKNYFYTNTGYVLLDNIISNITQHTYHEEITRLIEQANLKNTFYPIPNFDKSLQTRAAHGYNFNPYDNPALVGKDINPNLTWAGAAGGLISTSEDIIKWVKELFTTDSILDTKQRHQLVTMNSVTTGKPIAKTDMKNPEGFGLGVAQMYENAIRFWYYEGQTLGFRALYMYVPCNGIIISATVNSSTDHDNDHAKDLLLTIYKKIIHSNNEFACKG
jgi:D-alanyl-D-alanine carboxypeptidase